VFLFFWWIIVKRRRETWFDWRNHTLGFDRCSTIQMDFCRSTIDFFLDTFPTFPSSNKRHVDQFLLLWMYVVAMESACVVSYS